MKSVTSELFPFGCKADAEYPSSIVVACLPGKQDMKGSIPCEADYPFVPFYFHSIMLLLIHNSVHYAEVQIQLNHSAGL